MSAEALVVRAPATSANLGPGFDCAGMALELWNEVHVAPAAEGEPLVTIEGEGAEELVADGSCLALRAFALAAPVEGYRFHLVNRIPLERGLGSSAATVAAGVVAGILASGRTVTVENALELGLPLEGHADNLVPALAGGVCLTWRTRERQEHRRLADDLPLAPIVVVPGSRVNTKASRSRLPEFVRHEEAAAASAHSALLGAAIASGDEDLLAAAFHDRLHEPFRAPDAPLLEELRERPAQGQAGVTLSGSGPSVVVWARKETAAATAAELERRLPSERVLPLAIAARGAQALPGETPGPIPTLTTLGAPS